MGCLGALFGSHATQILTNTLTFTTFEFKNFFFFNFRKEKVDINWILMKTVLTQAQLFTCNHFRRGVFDGVSFAREREGEIE